RRPPPSPPPFPYTRSSDLEQMVDGPELIASRTALDEARALLAGRQATLKRLSHEGEDASIRLKAQEKRLYDGNIKNPKELSQVQDRKSTRLNSSHLGISYA